MSHLHTPTLAVDLEGVEIHGTPETWRVSVGYAMLMAILVIIWLCQRFGKQLCGRDLVEPPITDPDEASRKNNKACTTTEADAGVPSRPRLSARSFSGKSSRSSYC